MNCILLIGVLGAVLGAGGCASSADRGGGGGATAFEATGGVAAAKEAARAVLADRGVAIDEQADRFLAMLGAGGNGPVQLLRGLSPGGSEVTVTLSQAGTAGEVSVSVLVEDPPDPALQAGLVEDLRGALAADAPAP